VLVTETPIGPVQVANVHLRPPLNEQGRASLVSYFRTGDIRRKEIREIHRDVDPELPVLFAGDFNEHEKGDAVGLLRDLDFVDALSEFDRYTNTWEWNVGPSSLCKLRNRYDHILYSPRLRCLQARVIRGGASDHYPVLAVFEKLSSAGDEP